MGPVNSTTQHQDISNNVLQASRQSCNAGCNNSIADVTIIIEGGSGNINIDQECKLTNINCIMSASLNTQIENILKSMNDQSSKISGLTFPWNSTSNTYDLYQHIENTLTQTMDSSCTFSAENNASGIYMYVKDRTNNNINISQSSEITNATCNLNNLAKVVTYNDETSKNKQTAEVSGIFGGLFAVITVAIVMTGLVMIVFFISGGTKDIAEVLEKGVDKAGDIISSNPELLLAA